MSLLLRPTTQKRMIIIYKCVYVNRTHGGICLVKSEMDHNKMEWLVSKLCDLIRNDPFLILTTRQKFALFAKTLDQVPHSQPPV